MTKGSWSPWATGDRRMSANSHTSRCEYQASPPHQEPRKLQRPCLRPCDATLHRWNVGELGGGGVETCEPEYARALSPEGRSLHTIYRLVYNNNNNNNNNNINSNYHIQICLLDGPGLVSFGVPANVALQHFGRFTLLQAPDNHTILNRNMYGKP